MVGTSNKTSDDPQSNHKPRREDYSLRRHTIRPLWPNAIFENFYECASNDPGVLQVWCYTDRLSYAPGDTVQFHVSTTAERFDLEIARDGVRREVVFSKLDIPGTHHFTPEDCSVRGCGWPCTFEFTIPVGTERSEAEWRSGGYIITTRAKDANGAEVEHHHIMIVRAAESKNAPLLLIAATSTWVAYNEWGGSNHYEGITGPERDQFSPILSLERPFSRGFVVLPEGAPRIPLQKSPPPGAAPRYPHMEWAYANGYSKKYASTGWATYERHFVRWAEANGYQLDIATQQDLHLGKVELERYRCVVIVGHDEYWSWEMRDAIDDYVEHGGHVARFGANFIWQIRVEDEGQTQVCYKYRVAEDPMLQSTSPHLTTTCWEVPIVGRPGATTFGLNGSRGIYAGWGVCVPRGSGGFTVYRPEHWVFAGTDLYYGDVFGSEAKIFGYEVDGLDYVIRHGLPYPTYQDGAPKGIEILAMGLATLVEEDHGNADSHFFIGYHDLRFVAEALVGCATPDNQEQLKRGAGMMVVYQRGQGMVFNAGSCEWVAGLISKDFWTERITRNVLDRFIRLNSQ